MDVGIFPKSIPHVSYVDGKQCNSESMHLAYIDGVLKYECRSCMYKLSKRGIL